MKTEKELAEIVCESYATLDANIMAPHLADGFVYNQCWGFIPSTKEGFLHYLSSYFNYVSNHIDEVCLKSSVIHLTDVGRYVVKINEKNSESVLELFVKNGKIKQIERHTGSRVVSIPEIYDLILEETYPYEKVPIILREVRQKPSKDTMAERERLRVEDCILAIEKRFANEGTRFHWLQKKFSTGSVKHLSFSLYNIVYDILTERHSTISTANSTDFLDYKRICKFILLGYLYE